MISGTEIAHFLERGYVHIEEAIPRPLAFQCQALAAEALGIDRDTTAWTSPVQRGLVAGEPFAEAARAERLVGAVTELLRGERWMGRPDLGSLVVRFPSEIDPVDTGWHIDASCPAPGSTGTASWRRNYKSAGRGLLLLCLLSDVDDDDAPTRIHAGSHREIPALLRPFGDDGVGDEFAVPAPTSSAPVDLAVGSAGDVYICHPFLVHAATWPHRGTRPRFITQPPIGLVGALRLDAPDDALSVVARSVRESLG